MSQLGEFLAGMVDRSHRGTQARAALNTMAQFADDQDASQTEQMANRGKQANAIRNVIKSYSDNPDLGHALNSMGVDDLEGVMRGMATSMAMQEQQARAAEAMAQVKWLNQRTNESADEGNALANFASSLAGQMNGGGQAGNVQPNFGTPIAPALNFGSGSPLSDLGGMQPPPMDVPQANGAPQAAPNMQGMVLNAMAQMGKSNPRMAGVMLGKILPSILGSQSEDLTPGVFKDDTTGAHFVYRGKQLLPAGYDPNVTNAGKPVPMADPDGNLMGFSMTDIKGHQTFHPYKGNEVVKQVRDQDGNPVDGFFMDSQGHAINTNDALDKAGYQVTQDDNGNPRIQLKVNKPGAAAPAAKYKTKDDVVADYKAGKITRAAASKVLNEQFKVPFK
jgi:hypothetical protein